jgi:hypothetical protein
MLSGRSLCFGAEHSYREVLLTVECLLVIEEPDEGGLVSLGLSAGRISRQVVFVIFYS